MAAIVLFAVTGCTIQQPAGRDMGVPTATIPVGGFVGQDGDTVGDISLRVNVAPTISGSHVEWHLPDGRTATAEIVAGPAQRVTRFAVV